MEQNEIEKKRLLNAIEFLVFAYWGFCFNDDYGDDLDRMLTKIVSKAYNDAAGQGAFNALIETANSELRENADKAKTNSINLVKVQLGKFDDNHNGYKKWHEELCKGICDCFKDVKNRGELWSYGNSQKLVNMSVKYLITATYIFKSIGIPKNSKELCGMGDQFIGIIDELDVPVDSYIIETLWENNDIRLPIIKLNRDGSRGKYSSNKYTSWSKWNGEQYGNYEDGLKKHLKNEKNTNAFDWEGSAWMKIAKEKRKKDASDTN